MTEKKKFGKKYQRVEYSVFKDTADKLNLSLNQLVRELGYSKGAHKDWENKGTAPKVVGIACEGLRRRARIKNELVIKATSIEVISGDGNIKEIHPGIFVVEA